jgi:hypothetical protein
MKIEVVGMTTFSFLCELRGCNPIKKLPDAPPAYDIQKRSTVAAARLNLARWYDRTDEAGCHSFHIIAATFYHHSNGILNFYTNRSAASAESFNAKIKRFKAEPEGVPPLQDS